MVNANWLLVFWGFFTTVVVIFVVFGGQEAEAINEIKGYVSEAKAKEQVEPVEPVEVITEVIEEIKKLVTPQTPQKNSQITMIIGIQLSKTCYQMHKYNLTSNCPTYKDLLQFDNTIPEISGIFNTTDGIYQRQFSNYKKHCNYYNPDLFRLLIVIDPDGCWFRERGIKMITIQAISPDQMIYKLTADSATADKLRDMQRDERELYEDENEADKLVDRLEIAIEQKELQIIRLEDQVDDLDSDDPALKRRNLNFQLKSARDKLVDLNQDLKEEEADLKIFTTKLSKIRTELRDLESTTGSRLVINGTTYLGVGRYVKECREATVGADMQLITDTLNYFISKCQDTTFDSRKTSYIEQTPINIMDHKFYQFMKWQKEVMEKCKIKC